MCRVPLVRPLGANSMSLKEKLFLEANWQELCSYQWTAFAFVPKVICSQTERPVQTNKNNCPLVKDYTHIHTQIYLIDI